MTFFLWWSLGHRFILFPATKFFIPLAHYSSLMTLQSEKTQISQSNKNPGRLVDEMFIGEAIIESRLLS